MASFCACADLPRASRPAGVPIHPTPELEVDDDDVGLTEPDPARGFVVAGVPKEKGGGA
jgi:hypothetical protein